MTIVYHLVLALILTYDLSNIHLHDIVTIYRYTCITNTQRNQLPVGLIAQLIKHFIVIAEVMGSNPVQA